VEESLGARSEATGRAYSMLKETGVDLDISQTIRELEEEMITAANNLEFEKAALLRDQVRELKRTLDGAVPEKPGPGAMGTKRYPRARAKARG
jgi:excinuclease ABC subunit B